MLLAEQVRLVDDEEIILNDTTTYSQSAVTDWLVKKTQNVVLSKTKLVYVKTTYNNANGSNGQARVCIDGVPFLSTGGLNGATSITKEGWVVLGAGTYSFTFEIAVWVYAAACSISLCYIGCFNFVDLTGNNQDSGTISVPATSTTTMLNVNVSVPAARNTPLGAITKHILYLTAYMQGAERESNVLNVGESDVSSELNWRLFVNDSQVSWTLRSNDKSGSATNPTYGVGAFGFYRVALDPGQTVNFKIKVYNGNASAMNCRATFKAVLCPWFLFDSNQEPIRIDIPQGSTVYIVLEPLNSDPTKYLVIGKQRGISFGDATDYYYSVSGTGLVTASYTFEIVDPSLVKLYVRGLGGCISIIGVDVR